MKSIKFTHVLTLAIVLFNKAQAQQSTCIPVASTPTTSQNYVISNTIKDSIKLESQISALTNCQLNQTIQYFDGLGRPLQTVQVKASPLGKDIIVPIAYDAFGREDTRYQPYADPGTANGSYRPSAVASQLSFYTSATGSIRPSNYPFSKTVYEKSPLNRVLEQGAPGNIYQPGARVTAGGRTVVTEYAVEDTLDVPYVRLTATGVIANTFYPSGKLYKTITKDENWTSGKANTTEEYKDFQGRVVMKKVWQTNTSSLMTFYVYDDFGNLRYVIPPFPGAPSIVTLNETDDLFKKYCYAYHYDGRNRLIDKKIPGKDVDYIVYNTLDQVVLTQDPKQRTEHKWAFTKYDALGRTIVTGLLINPQTIDSVRKLVNKQTVLWETWGKDLYTSVAFPQVFDYYHQAFFYDDYKYPVPKLYGMASASKKTKGLLTQVATFVMATASYMVEVNHYDDYGRVIKNFKQHYASSTIDSLNYDETTNAYNFAGELKSSTRVHYKRGATNTTVAMAYEYDAWGRKAKTKEKINADAQVLLSENLYNEIGGLQEKQLHNGLQKTQFTYIERGWFLTKSSNEFSEALKYVDSVGSRLYNGNIPYQKWGYSRATPNVFSYTYDGLNRLTKATTNTATPLNETISYDTMGNIDSLNRNGVGGKYANSGNQLTKITGGLGTDPYVYDANGNMTTDGRNKTTIAYNMLSLPLTVSKTGLTINYLYSADGAKLEKKSNATGTAITTHYVDGIQYTGSSIDFIQTEEGLARRNKGTDDKGVTYSYEYNLTDHLGNVRLTFNQNPTTGALAVLQKDDYFAFGKRNPVQAGSNKYLYNGKELQEELETYDYGARFYDPVIARWTTIDPLAEAMRRHSPYNYGFNNPIRFIDPDGMRPVDDYVFDQDGDFQRIDKNNKPDKLVVENSQTGARQSYNFADPEADTRDIANGTINKVVFVDNKKMTDMLGKAGALDPTNREGANEWGYMNRESKGGGKLDFSYSSIPGEFPGASKDPLNTPSSMLFIPEGDGNAHNHMNFGNFLWGAAGSALGFSTFELKGAAQYNSLMNSATNGYNPQLDSKDDQFSIGRGINFSQTNKLNDRTWTPSIGISPFPNKKR
jgi:RHS repeat-associated protein